MFMVERLNIVKMPALPNLIYRFNAIPVKISASFFFFLVNIDELILKFMWRGKKTQNSQLILKEKTKDRGLILTNFKIYSKAAIFKTVWYWQKKKKNQWNKVESQEIDSLKYSQLIFDRGAKAIQWSKDSLFNKRYWDKRIYTYKKKSRHRPSTFHKN